MKNTMALTADIQIQMANFMADSGKALNGNKAAAARCRKATLNIQKLGAEYRKQSVIDIG